MEMYVDVRISDCGFFMLIKKTLEKEEEYTETKKTCLENKSESNTGFRNHRLYWLQFS